MAELTASQLKKRERVESLIQLMAPLLDLVLAAGDRISRVVEPEDHNYYPARPLSEPDPDVPPAPRDRVAPRPGRV